MISLRKNQQDALDAIHESEESKQIIKMFCGTGKTRLFHKIILEDQDDLIVLVFPRIALVTQYLNDYLKNEKWPLDNLEYLLVCSESETDDATFTTKEDDIIDFVLNPNLFLASFCSPSPFKNKSGAQIGITFLLWSIL